MHKWTLKTPKGNPKCSVCGINKETHGKGKRSNTFYYKVNKPVGIGPLGNKAPPCIPKEEASK